MDELDLYYDGPRQDLADWFEMEDEGDFFDEDAELDGEDGDGAGQIYDVSGSGDMRKKLLVAIARRRGAKKKKARAKRRLCRAVLWLKKHLHAGNNPGSAARPSKLVAVIQKAMGRIAVDGCYGPETQRRAYRLCGVKIRSRKGLHKHSRPSPLGSV